MTNKLIEAAQRVERSRQMQAREKVGEIVEFFESSIGVRFLVEKFVQKTVVNSRALLDTTT